MGLIQSSCRFILLPGFVGLVCYGCGFADKASIGLTLTESNDGLSVKNEIAEKSAVNAVAAQTVAVEKNAGVPSTVAVTTASSSSAAAAAYREAINLASGAYHLSQSAISPDDWGLIASRWQRAANLLKKVTKADENYPVAQQKMAEYSRNAEQAIVEIQALQRSVQTPLPVHRQVLQPAPSISHAGSSHSVSARATGGAKIPVVRRLHGTPVVRVTFNDAKSYDMILDTGASRTLITRQMANELGIVETERMLAATASESEVSFGLGQVRSISMGQVTLQNARVGIGDSVDIGLLGNDFLSGYDVTIRDRDNVVELVAAE